MQDIEPRRDWNAKGWNGPALLAEVGERGHKYVVRFATEDQAVAYVEPRWETHRFSELKDEPINGHKHQRLYDLLYPTCEHGLSLENCNGPQHYWFDEEEQARGYSNGW